MVTFQEMDSAIWVGKVRIPNPYIINSERFHVFLFSIKDSIFPIQCLTIAIVFELIYI